MATKIPDPAQMLAELVHIADQMTANRTVDRDRVRFARQLDQTAQQLQEWGGALLDLGVQEDALVAVADRLRTWATGLVPQADTQWHREEVTAKLALLDSLARLGLLTDDQSRLVSELQGTLATKRGPSSGGTRTPQERIAGRPEKVAASMDGEVFSTQVGNVATSASNLKQAAIRFISKKEGLDPKQFNPDAAKMLLQAANQVCTGKDEWADALGVRFQVVA